MKSFSFFPFVFLSFIFFFLISLSYLIFPHWWIFLQVNLYKYVIVFVNMIIIEYIKMCNKYSRHRYGLAVFIRVFCITHVNIIYALRPPHKCYFYFIFILMIFLRFFSVSFALAQWLAYRQLQQNLSLIWISRKEKIAYVVVFNIVERMIENLSGGYIYIYKTILASPFTSPNIMNIISGKLKYCLQVKCEIMS